VVVFGVYLIYSKGLFGSEVLEGRGRGSEVIFYIFIFGSTF
jgi:hypothetical protein